MGPKRIEYEKCRKALNAFALVETFGELGNDLRKARYDLENKYGSIKSEVIPVRTRFENARSRHSDLQRMLYDVFWGTIEREHIQQMERTAAAELNIAEQEWNDI